MILLYNLLGFVKGPGNSIAAVLLCVMPSPIVVVHICLLTLCHVRICVLNPPAAASVAMHWKKHVRRVSLSSKGVSVRFD